MALVYTAIAGDYPIPPRSEIPCLSGDAVFTRPVMDAKRYKILPHLYCPDEPVTIWVDGNIWPLVDADTLIDRYLGKADMALFSHPRRNSVWQEFAELRKDAGKGGRFNIPYLQTQLTAQEAAYRKAKFPGGPLFECNFIIRRNNEAVNRLNDAWWSEICRWQWRDQVSFPYVLWRYGGVKVNTICGPDIRKNKDFRYVPHY